MILSFLKALFKKKVEQTLKGNPHYPENLNRFIDQLKQYFGLDKESPDYSVLIKGLTPVKFSLGKLLHRQ